MRTLLFLLVFAPGCLINEALYKERKNDLTDHDGDRFVFEDDCDDLNPAIFPGAEEVCNGLDDNCNGRVDEDAVDELTVYRDNDGDGYGVETVSQQACSASDGWVVDSMDCDDEDPLVFPGGVDLVDGVDQDCDDVVDQAMVESVKLGSWGAPRPHSRAGEAVAMADLDGDGHTDLVVGAPGDATYPEAVSGLFFLPGPLNAGGSLEAGGSISHPQATTLGRYLGVVETAGQTHLLAGVPEQEDSFGRIGDAVLVLDGLPEADSEAEDWPHVVRSTGGSTFGRAAGGAGDWDGDGVVDWFVSDESQNRGAQGAGVVFVVPGGTKDGFVEDVALETVYSDHFQAHLGEGVAAVPDSNGDGYPELLVGAPQHSSDGDFSGRAFLIGPSGDALTEVESGAMAVLLSIGEGCFSGYRVAATDDLDQDGRPEMLVGHLCMGVAGGGQVAAYQGSLAGTVLLEAATWRWEGPHEGSDLGRSLVSGQSSGLLALGVPGFDAEGAQQAGAVALLDLAHDAGGTIGEVGGLYIGPDHQGSLGVALAADSGLLAVGCPGCSGDDERVGGVWIVPIQ